MIVQPVNVPTIAISMDLVLMEYIDKKFSNKNNFNKL
jgi:hypothetical protein